MSNQQTCEGLLSAISLPELVSGRSHCAELGGQTICLFGQHPAPANLSARQAKAMGLLTSGTYGRLLPGSLSSAALQSRLESRLQARLQTTGSTLYKLTWKPWVTPMGPSRSRLRASALPISVIELTGWPTPTTNVKNHQPSERGLQTLAGVALHLSSWITPTTRDHKDTPGMTAQRDGKDRVDQLPRQAYLTAWPTASDGTPTQLANWPTPRAADGTKNVRSLDGSLSEIERKGSPQDLHQAAHLCLATWPTPNAGTPQSLRGNGQDPERRKEQGHQVGLKDAVRYLIHNEPARLTATGEMLTGSSAEMESGGQLNPAHSRWLMGLPPEWDACAPTETPSILKRQLRFFQPLTIQGVGAMSAMQINITHKTGKVLVDCYGMFSMNINGHDFLFALTDDASGDILEVTEYVSGLRWPVQLEEAGGKALGLASPPNPECEIYQAVLAKAKQRIISDIVVRTSNGNGTEEDIARVILRNQKQYKANEVDF